MNLEHCISSVRYIKHSMTFSAAANIHIFKSVVSSTLRHSWQRNVCVLLNLWSVWISSAAYLVLSAPVGNRLASGRAADGEEPAAETHTETPESTAGGTAESEAQAPWQTNGKDSSHYTILNIQPASWSAEVIDRSVIFLFYHDRLTFAHQFSIFSFSSKLFVNIGPIISFFFHHFFFFFNVTGYIYSRILVFS